MAKPRSEVTTSFWTFESLAETDRLLEETLTSLGFEKSTGHGEATDHQSLYERKNAKSSLWHAWQVSTSLSTDRDRTQLRLTAHCHPRLVALVPFSLLILYSWVVGGLAVLVYVPGASDYSFLYALGMLPLVLVSAFIHPLGLIPAIRYSEWIKRTAKSSFSGASYKLHDISGIGESRIFGRTLARSLFWVVLPFCLLAFLFWLVTQGGLAWLFGGGILVLAGIQGSFWLSNKKRRPVTVEHRIGVGLAVAFTYMAILASGPICTLFGAINPDAQSLQHYGPSMLVIALLFLSACLFWNMVQREEWDLNRIHEAGEFEEHAIPEQESQFFPGTLIFLLCVVFAFELLSVLFVLDLVGLVPEKLTSIGSFSPIFGFIREAAIGERAVWAFAIVTFLGIRVAGLVVFARPGLRPETQSLRTGTQEKIAKALQREPPQLNIEFEELIGESSVAACKLRGAVAPTFVIYLGTNLLKPESGKQLEAIMAHELAHCILGHHQKTRWLRILGALLFLDPVALTSFIDHTDNEEQADMKAIRLLGGDQQAADQLATAIEFTRDNAHGSSTPWLHCPAGLGLSGMQQQSREASHADQGRGFFSRSWRGFRTYLGTTRILYIHPSLEHRLGKIRAFAADVKSQG